MAGYRVLESFSDLMDKEHIYRPGDAFPREGYEASIDRLTSLAGSNNKLGRPLIEFVPDSAPEIEDPIPQEEKPKRGRRKAK